MYTYARKEFSPHEKQTLETVKKEQHMREKTVEQKLVAAVRHMGGIARVKDYSGFENTGGHDA